MLASKVPNEVVEDKVNDLNSELNLVSCQEDIPENVLIAHGYDLPKIGVLSPSEMIKVISIVEFKKFIHFFSVIGERRK